VLAARGMLAWVLPHVGRPARLRAPAYGGTPVRRRRAPVLPSWTRG